MRAVLRRRDRRTWSEISLRWLALLAIGAALTGLSPCGPADDGITAVGADADGSLTARHEHSYTSVSHYRSVDGGFTWKFITTMEQDQEKGMTWGGVSTETPRGRYIVTETDIVRTDSSGRAFYYATTYFQDYANVVLQNRDNRKRSGGGVQTTKAHNIFYDSTSGNVVAAMGSQGVAVGTPDGRWTRVAVVDLKPTDFSRLQRTLLLMSVPSFWITALVLLIAFQSFVFILAVCRWQEFVGAAIIAAIILAAVYAIIAIGDDTVVFVSILSGPIVGIIILAVSRKYNSLHKSMAAAAVGFVAAAAILGFPGFNPDYFPETSGFFRELFILLMILTALAVGMTALAAMRYRPRGLDQRDAFIALGAMFAALLLPTIMWLQYAIAYEAAKALSIALAGAGALVLLGRLKWRQRSQGQESGFRK